MLENFNTDWDKLTRITSNSKVIVIHIYMSIALMQKVLPSISLREISHYISIVVAQIAYLSCKHKYKPKIVNGKLSKQRKD